MSKNSEWWERVCNTVYPTMFEGYGAVCIGRITCSRCKTAFNNVRVKQHRVTVEIDGKQVVKVYPYCIRCANYRPPKRTKDQALYRYTLFKRFDRKPIGKFRKYVEFRALVDKSGFDLSVLYSNAPYTTDKIYFERLAKEIECRNGNGERPRNYFRWSTARKSRNLRPVPSDFEEE